MQMLSESMALKASSPKKQMAKNCLSEKNYLLWKTEFSEQCQATAERNQAQQVPISFDMLASERVYWEIDQKLNFDAAVNAKISTTAKKAWNKLLSFGLRTYLR